VNEHGAVGDGSTDDLPAFNSAVSAAAPNGVVLIPNPDTFYYLNGDLVVQNLNGVTFLGSGSPPVKFQDGNSLIFDGGSEHASYGVAWETTDETGSATSSIIEFTGAVSAVDIVNNRIRFGKTGLEVTGDASQLQLRRNQIDNVENAFIENDPAGGTENNIFSDNIVGIINSGSGAIVQINGDHPVVKNNIFETTVSRNSVEIFSTIGGQIGGNELAGVSGPIIPGRACELGGNQYRVLLEKTTDQTGISAATDTTIDWDNQSVDGELFTYDSTNDEIEFDVAGDYTVSVATAFKDVTAGSDGRVRLVKNGSIILRDVRKISNGTLLFLTGSVTEEFGPGDTLRFDARCDEQFSVTGGDKFSFITVAYQ
jgi:hypothetical protein